MAGNQVALRRAVGDRGAWRPLAAPHFRRQASQDARRRVARVFVASGDPSERIAGFYTLRAASFERDNLPAETARRLPHYPVPAAVIGRLAIDLRSQGSGLGEGLLVDAIHRVVRAGDTIGVHTVVADALHDRASASCERYGFAPFASQPLRLYLPLRTFEQLGLQAAPSGEPQERNPESGNGADIRNALRCGGPELAEVTPDRSVPVSMTGRSPAGSAENPETPSRCRSRMRPTRREAAVSRQPCAHLRDGTPA